MNQEYNSYRFCLVCKKREVKSNYWICKKCYRYIGNKIIEDVIQECGGSYQKIPNHIPKNQYEDYFTKLLKKRRTEKENVKNKQEVL